MECMEYYGCDDAGEAYSWCEVDEASCPESSRDVLLGPGPEMPYQGLDVTGMCAILTCYFLSSSSLIL